MRWNLLSPHRDEGRKCYKFYGLEWTHREMHYAEILDEKRNVLWHGRIPVSRDRFLQLLEKIRTIEKSNSQKIAAVYMNPTGNYHMTLK